MGTGLTILIIAAGILGIAIVLTLVILFFRWIIKQLKKLGCKPFTYGGFDEDNGYDDPRFKKY